MVKPTKVAQKRPIRGASSARTAGRGKRGTQELFVATPTKPKRVEDDEEIESSDDEDEPQKRHRKQDDDFEEEEEELYEEEENADEKRLKIAQKYIASLESKPVETEDFIIEEAPRRSNDVHMDSVALKLRKDVMKKEGKCKDEIGVRLFERLAASEKWERVQMNRNVIGGKDDVADADGARIQVICADPDSFTRGHTRAPTGVCIGSGAGAGSAYTSGKDGFVIAWDLTTGAIKSKLRCESASKAGTEIRPALSSVSSSEHLVAAGAADGTIRVWDVRTGTQTHAHTGHRGAVAGVCFRMDAMELFSGGQDRTVKLWNAAEGAYIDTLYGHIASVTCAHALNKERVLTGGSDHTVRLWKIPEESQLVFRGNRTSIDAVGMINDEQFVTGDQLGEVCLWSVLKKKASVRIRHADVAAPYADVSKRQQRNEHWVSAVATRPFSDLIASGSDDGRVVFYSADAVTRRMDPLGYIRVSGWVNGIAIGDNVVAIATGKEHRLGRWMPNKAAVNGLALVSLGSGSLSS